MSGEKGAREDDQSVETTADPVSIVALARKAVESFVREERIPEPIPPIEAASLPERAGVFVTIRHTNGDLRGCIGTIDPVTPSIPEEVIRCALLSATEDPRFPPVRLDELDDLVYSVSVLAPPERISSAADLDPALYGVIVQTEHRRGLLLPNIPGIDSVEDQLTAVRRKAGISKGASVEIYRFATIHFYE